MAIILKIKFDPKRGGAQSYDFISPAMRVDDWSDATFSVLESTDNITYTALEENIDWRADIDWYELLQQLYSRRYRDIEPADQKERAKRMRFLQYRGFSFDLIRQVLS